MPQKGETNENKGGCRSERHMEIQTECMEQRGKVEMSCRRIQDIQSKEIESPDVPFFLAIKHQRNLNNPRHCWFKNCPLGKNQMYKLVPKMKANYPALNDGRRITNHSVRKHVLQK